MPQQQPTTFSSLWLRNCAVVLIVGLILVGWCWWPRSPEGRFRNDDMATSSLCYFEFRDGHVFLTIEVEASGDEAEGSDDMGWYGKSGKRWIWVSKTGYTNELRTTMFSITMIDDHSTWSKTFPRILTR
jgi:hypothetical protein